ncbi:MAG: hypothetical protein KKA79_07405 [Nanoarchaeota archaeon]|nr:hypothetical protein [Nanoarchaeota archaeon]MCG2718578.1 hypothetical protein [Nanoarchaeota archaeon]
MYNLKKGKGTFKGNIGECMFKLTKKKLFLTRFHSKYKVLNLISKFLSFEQKSFLKNNWFSLDGIELVDSKIIIYEIKTKNRYRKRLKYRPKTTSNTLDLYNHAIQLGFIVKIVFVWLEKDWDYSLEFKDFNPSILHCDKSKPYDKK